MEFKVQILSHLLVGSPGILKPKSRTLSAITTYDTNFDVLKGGSIAIDLKEYTIVRFGELNTSSYTLTVQPNYGQATLDTTTGIVTYTHNGESIENDTIYYMVQSSQGNSSNQSVITISIFIYATADYFTATTLDTSLWVIPALFDNPKITYGIQDNELVLTNNINSHGGVSWDAPHIRQNIGDSDFDLVVKTFAPSKDSHSVGLFLGYGNSGANWLAWEVYNSTGSKILTWAATRTNSKTTIVHDNLAPELKVNSEFYLRVKRVGSNYTFYISIDGRNWLERSNLSRSSVFEYCGLYSWSNGIEIPYTSSFDLFENFEDFVPPEPPQIFYSDNFSGSTLDTNKWTYTTPTTGQIVSSYSVADGALNLQINSGTNDIWSTKNDPTTVLQNCLPGDIRIETQLLGLPVNANQFAGLYLYQDPNNWIRFDISQRSNTFRLFFAMCTNSSVVSADNTTIVDRNAPNPFLRVSLVNGSCSSFYSANGDVWLEAVPTRSSVIKPTKVGVFLIRPASGQVGVATAKFNYIRNLAQNFNIV